MHESAGSIFQNMTLERDRQELSLGDVLDVKAGILLAVIAVLGTLSGTLLVMPTLGTQLEIAQLGAILCLAIACVFAVLTVIPRNYLFAGTPRTYEKWGEELRRSYASDEETTAAIASGIVKQATERIEKNQLLNKEKSRLLSLAFWPALVALAVNIVTLVVLESLKVLS